MYPEWRGAFYPKELPQRAELAYLAERVDTAEINGSFYSLHAPSDAMTLEAAIRRRMAGYRST